MVVNMASGAWARYPSDRSVWLVPDASTGGNPAATPPPGPYDGKYVGTFDGTAIPFKSYASVELTVDVVSGHGTGTTTAAGCAVPGEVRLTIEPSGEVHGGMDLIDTKCRTRRVPFFEGQMRGDRMLIREPGSVAYLVKRP
jgi:hypothetical protein